MPVTYEPIQTTTLGSSTATVTLNSIPQTYTDLVIVMNYKSTNSPTGGSVVTARVNNDSSSLYSTKTLEGNGSGNLSQGQSNQAQTWLIGFQGIANAGPYTTVMNINNYSNTTSTKTHLTLTGSGSIAIYAGLYRGTAGISRVDITSGNGSFAANSTFTVYGIKAA